MKRIIAFLSVMFSMAYCFAQSAMPDWVTSSVPTLAEIDDSLRKYETPPTEKYYKQSMIFDKWDTLLPDSVQTIIIETYVEVDSALNYKRHWDTSFAVINDFRYLPDYDINPANPEIDELVAQLRMKIKEWVLNADYRKYLSYINLRCIGKINICMLDIRLTNPRNPGKTGRKEQVRTSSLFWGSCSDPYGSMFADAGRGAEVQPLSFGGKELDAMYGLQWLDFGARYHSPQVAAFTRPDPMAAKYPHLSPYLYCANDPVNHTDPTGMDWVTNLFNEDKFFFFDQRITCVADVKEFYGSDTSISYIGESGSFTHEGVGEVNLLKGGGFEINGERATREYDANNLHIGSTDFTRIETIFDNWYGSYCGPNNPKAIGDGDSYAVPPSTQLDYAAFQHDKGYDAVGAAGLSGVLFNSRTLDADLKLVWDASKSMVDIRRSPEERIYSRAAFWGFLLVSMYKIGYIF